MSAAALERQIRPIYDAIDTGSNKSAIVACNKVLKRQPNNVLVKALKALALVRSQKVDESLVLCDEVLASKPTEDATLSAMMHVLRTLGRHTDMVAMFEHAYKQQPANEELGAQTFFANVRTGNWKLAQQVATKMHKQFQQEHYLYWSVMSAVLQANDPTTPGNMRSLLYKLAHRLLTSSSPSYFNADRLYLHLSIYRELDMIDEAYSLLESDAGKAICLTSLVCNDFRREVWRCRGLLKEEAERSELMIVEKQDRNWLEFLSILDATFSGCTFPDDTVAPDLSESIEQDCMAKITKTRALFTRIAELDGSTDRSALLALLELEKRARVHGFTNDTGLLVHLMEQYFQKIGDKTCCFEDLKPYLPLEDDDLSRWTRFLESFMLNPSQVQLRRLINVHKLLRYNLRQPQVTPAMESARAMLYVKEYLRGLEFGIGLPVTELQPADDLVILAANVFVNLWQLTDDEVHLYTAAASLEFASTRSKHSFRIRLLLIRIYRLLGASSLALEHYRLMDIKQIQNDTLSHFILSRASTFSLAAIGDLTYASECLESTQIYLSNSQETSDYVIRAFTNEKYSQIAEFITFEDRLDNSLQRDLMKFEHVRIRLTHEIITSDIIDSELIELKFVFDRFHHDNRDFEIIPNYQPAYQSSLNEQTLLFKKNAGLGWLRVFLKMYIRAFQQASDLDDTVEQKLLVGDRPKHSRDPLRLHWKEQLVSRQEEDLQDLTPDEHFLLEYATALADWLGPYHDYIRPSPASVLAEAAKQTELKTGHPLKGFDLPAHQNTNGHGKKAEEAPAVKEPPSLVSSFFDDMQARFRIVRKEASVSVVIHVANLTQEALILLVIQTLRFKPQSIIKIHKLGALVQSCKDVRAKALNVLRDMSAALLEMAELEGTAESRHHFVTACNPLEVDRDFILSVAKKVTDARKKVLEGIGKGIARVCSTYSQKGTV